MIEQNDSLENVGERWKGFPLLKNFLFWHRYFAGSEVLQEYTI